MVKRVFFLGKILKKKHSSPALKFTLGKLTPERVGFQKGQLSRRAIFSEAQFSTFLNLLKSAREFNNFVPRAFFTIFPGKKVGDLVSPYTFFL